MCKSCQKELTPSDAPSLISTANGLMHDTCYLDALKNHSIDLNLPEYQLQAVIQTLEQRVTSRRLVN